MRIDSANKEYTLGPKASGRRSTLLFFVIVLFVPFYFNQFFSLPSSASYLPIVIIHFPLFRLHHLLLLLPFTTSFSYRHYPSPPIPSAFNLSPFLHVSLTLHISPSSFDFHFLLSLFLLLHLNFSSFSLYSISIPLPFLLNHHTLPFFRSFSFFYLLFFIYFSFSNSSTYIFPYHTLPPVVISSCSSFPSPPPFSSTSPRTVFWSQALKGLSWPAL